MNNWFEIWCEDTQNMISCVVHNMQADLKNGYDPNGFSIWQSKAIIAELKESYTINLARLTEMSAHDAQNWCYYDLKRRGAI